MATEVKEMAEVEKQEVVEMPVAKVAVVERAVVKVVV